MKEKQEKQEKLWKKEKPRKKFLPKLRDSCWPLNVPSPRCIRRQLQFNESTRFVSFLVTMLHCGNFALRFHMACCGIFHHSAVA